MNATKTTVIHQPDFIPYLGFFHRLLHADLFILLDHVQFAPRNWTHRDKIKTPRGEQWLTISTKKAPRDTAIHQVEISTEIDWASQHLNILHENYRQAPYYRELLPHLEELYSDLPRLMSAFNQRSIEMLCRLLDITIPMERSSNMMPEGSKTMLLIDLLQKSGSDAYLTGTGSRSYLEEEAFKTAGIRLIWQEFAHPTYPQLHGEFIPFLSTIDALFNCGIEGTRNLLRNC